MASAVPSYVPPPATASAAPASQRRAQDTGVYDPNGVGGSGYHAGAGFAQPQPYAPPQPQPQPQPTPNQPLLNPYSGGCRAPPTRSLLCASITQVLTAPSCRVGCTCSSLEHARNRRRTGLALPHCLLPSHSPASVRRSNMCRVVVCVAVVWCGDAQYKRALGLASGQPHLTPAQHTQHNQMQPAPQPLPVRTSLPPLPHISLPLTFLSLASVPSAKPTVRSGLQLRTAPGTAMRSRCLSPASARVMVLACVCVCDCSMPKRRRMVLRSRSRSSRKRTTTLTPLLRCSWQHKCRRRRSPRTRTLNRRRTPNTSPRRPPTLTPSLRHVLTDSLHTLALTCTSAWCDPVLCWCALQMLRAHDFDSQQSSSVVV
jgi:hypothetical protein